MNTLLDKWTTAWNRMSGFEQVLTCLQVFAWVSIAALLFILWYFAGQI